jgi:hypothetical protein
MRSPRCPSSFWCATLFLSAASYGQTACLPSWEALSTPGVVPGVGGPAFALATTTVGGTGIAVGGAFTTAGGIPAARLAVFDGAAWRTAGGGLDATVRALVEFDDGTGPALYVGGDFLTAGGVPAAHVARFDGATYSALGPGLNGSVRAFAVFDDGAGPALYAGGAFTAPGGAAGGGVAKWDGSAWIPLGLGFDGPVAALAVFDDGSGPALFAGGAFATADGLPAAAVAQWNGVGWSALGGGLSAATGAPPPEVEALATGDVGQGPRLYAGGRFEFADGAPVAHLAGWDGAAWTATGLTATAVKALAIRATGGAPRLFAAATFVDQFGATALAVLERATLGALVFWNVAGSLGTPLTQSAHALLPVAGPGGEELLLAGDFSAVGGGAAGAGTAANHVARLAGGAWAPFGAGLAGQVRALKELDLGQGPALYAGGYFSVGGGAAVRTAAGFSAFAPSFTATPFFGVAAHAADYAVYDCGAGPELYATGYFASAGGAALGNVARLSNGVWTPLGAAGLGGFGYALAVFDDGSGPSMFVGGSFNTAGNLPTSHLARWDGAAWHAVPGLNGAVRGLVVHDDGSGPALYVAGNFTSVAGTPMIGVVRRRNGAWESVGGGVSGFLAASGFRGGALAVHDDGAGPRLYLAGNFTHAGGVLSNGVARWDSFAWSGLATGLGGIGVSNLELSSASFATSGGPRLVVAGPFASAGGTFAPGVAFWDGAAWGPAPVGGTSASPTAPSTGIVTLAVHDAGDGARLFAGGGGTAFTGGVNLARWSDPAPGIRRGPVGASAAVGGIATFSAEVAGAGPYAFQWRKDGVAISGADQPALTLTGLAATDAGLYDAVVTGACGVATSAAVPLWVSSTTFALSKPTGPGSFRAQNAGGPPGFVYVNGLTFDGRNAAGLGAGNFCGLWIAESELLAEAFTFSPPFIGFFDAAGAALFELPAGSLPPFLAGLSFFGASATLDPATFFVVGCSNPTVVVL